MSSPVSSEHLTDFSDRLSPMLVKELRQGMRTHLFTIAFILLQAFMVLCVLLGASAPGDGSSLERFGRLLGSTPLLLDPARGESGMSRLKALPILRPKGSLPPRGEGGLDISPCCCGCGWCCCMDDGPATGELGCCCAWY